MRPTLGLLYIKERSIAFGRWPGLDHLFYLPSDPRFGDMPEAFLNFCQIQPLDKGYLNEGKAPFVLTTTAVKALLKRYRDYLSIVPE